MQGKTISFKKEDQTLSGVIVAEYLLKGTTHYLTKDADGNLHHVPASDIESSQ